MQNLGKLSKGRSYTKQHIYRKVSIIMDVEQQFVQNQYNTSQLPTTVPPSTDKSNEDSVIPKAIQHVQELLSVHFFTQIADESFHLSNDIFQIPSKLENTELSKIIHHLLLKQKKKTTNIDFSFLINNKYITDSIANHLLENEISSESMIDIEYIEKSIEPSSKSNNEHSDWVSCLDAIFDDRYETTKNPHLFITGCYDGIVRVWNIDQEIEDENKNMDNKLFTHYRAHFAPIKDICTLYSTQVDDQNENIHYFATVAKDCSIKVLSFNEKTKVIEEICHPINNKKTRNAMMNNQNTRGHSLSVECVSAPHPSKLFASGSVDKTIKIWRVITHDSDSLMDNPPLKKRKMMDNSMADENVLADKEMSLKCLSTLNGHSDVVQTVDWNSPCALYSASWDKRIKIWDIQKEVDQYTWLTSSAIHSMRYWTARNLLLTAHSNLKIALWDPRTNMAGKSSQIISSRMSSHRTTFRSHPLPITSVAVCNQQLSAFDYLFASGSHDGRIKIWDIRKSSQAVHNIWHDVRLYENKQENGNKNMLRGVKVLCVGWHGNIITSGASDCKLRSFQF